MSDDELLNSRTANSPSPLDALQGLEIETHCDDELMWVVGIATASPPADKDETEVDVKSEDEAQLARHDSDTRAESPASEGDLVSLEELKHHIMAHFPTAAARPPRAQSATSRNPRDVGRGKAKPTARPKTVSRPTSASSAQRPYQRSTRAHQRQVESREEQFAKDKARSRPQPSDHGPAAFACKRLHEQTQRKTEEMSSIRDKYDKEFASMAPFSPSTSDRGGSQRREFQTWIQDQEAWRSQRDEKRAQRRKGRAEEEDNYAKQHSVHRDLSHKDMNKAVDRLYASHKKSQEKLDKLRLEKMDQEMQHLQQASVHRNVAKMPGASEKVQSSIHRLYHQDLKKRQKWLQEQADAKLRDQDLEEHVERESARNFEGQVPEALDEPSRLSVLLREEDHAGCEASDRFQTAPSEMTPFALDAYTSKADGGQSHVASNERQREVEAAVQIAGPEAESFTLSGRHAKAKLREPPHQRARLLDEKPSDGAGTASDDEGRLDFVPGCHGVKRDPQADDFFRGSNASNNAETRSENAPEICDGEQQAVSSPDGTDGEPVDEELLSASEDSGGIGQRNSQADSSRSPTQHSFSDDSVAQSQHDELSPSELGKDDGERPELNMQLHPQTPLSSSESRNGVKSGSESGEEPSQKLSRSVSGLTESQDQSCFASEHDQDDGERQIQDNLSDDPATASQDQGSSASDQDKHDRRMQPEPGRDFGWRSKFARQKQQGLTCRARAGFEEEEEEVQYTQGKPSREIGWKGEKTVRGERQTGFCPKTRFSCQKGRDVPCASSAASGAGEQAGSELESDHWETQAEVEPYKVARQNTRFSRRK